MEMRYPGAAVIPIGVVVMGYDGDKDKDRRPLWAKDGTFMVTRKLDNLVPEFDNFLLKHGPKLFPDLPPQKAADKLGAQLFGRWKNGKTVSTFLSRAYV
jgi:deferrochelatase/peroxidase EfeB